MKKSIIVTFLLSGMLLTSCSSNTVNTIEEPIAPTEKATEAPAVVEEYPIPRPDASQEETLTRDIGAINPLFINRRTIDNARNQCSSILYGSSIENEDPAHREVTLIEQVKVRFSGLGVESVSDEEANQLLSVIRNNGFCTLG